MASILPEHFSFPGASCPSLCLAEIEHSVLVSLHVGWEHRDLPLSDTGGDTLRIFSTIFTTATARGDVPFGIVSLFARPKLDPCSAVFKCSSFSCPLSVHSKRLQRLNCQTNADTWQWSRGDFGLKCSRICTIRPLFFPYPW